MIPSRFMAQDHSSPNVPDKGLKIVSAADPADKNNNFYDNADTYALPGGEIMVEGEIENPGFVDFSALQKHSLIIKEALLGPDGKRYHADIVLQDPSNGVPLVVFEVKSPGKTTQQTESNLRRILDSQRYFESWGGKQPKVVLLVAGSDRDEAARIKRAVNARGVQVEVV